MLFVYIILMVTKADLSLIRETFNSSLRNLKRDISDSHEITTILKGDLYSLQSSYRDISNKLAIINLKLDIQTRKVDIATKTMETHSHELVRRINTGLRNSASI